MWITAFFTENGAAKSGLSPTLNGVQLLNTPAITAQTMTESTIISGLYGYNWGAYDPTKDYYFVADGGATLTGNDRLKHGSGAEGDIKLVLDDTDAMDTRLPTDPADQSDVEAAITAATAPLAVEVNVEGHVIDALDTYDPPTRTEATSDKDEIISEINDNEVKIDALPADTADAVWRELLVDHLGPGRAAQFLNDIYDLISGNDVLFPGTLDDRKRFTIDEMDYVILEIKKKPGGSSNDYTIMLLAKES